MSDSFKNQTDSVESPARRVAAFVPDDGIDLGEVTKGIYVGTGGDLALVAVDAPANAPAVVFRNLPAGALLPVRARRVAATGTTASDLLALL